MTKRILSLLLAAMMVLGSLVVVSAAEPDYAAENTWAVEVLSKINVLQGDENGDPMLENAILRYEMALFLARALTGNTDDAYWAKVENETPFDDLLTHPYNGAATWNYNHGIIFGVTDTIFNPNGNITYQDAIVMVVRAWADHFLTDGLEALGFKDELHYPWKHIELADDLGLTDNIDPNEKYLEATTRGVVAQLVYNLLTWTKATSADDNYLDNFVKYKYTESIGAKNFKLAISAKDGDTFKVTEVKDGKVKLDSVPADGEAVVKLELTEADFTKFEETAKKLSTYNVIYYKVDKEVVVIDIDQISVDGSTYANTPDERTFEVVFTVTDATKDKKDAEKLYNATKLVVDGKEYALTGDKALKSFTIAGKTLTELGVTTLADLTPAQVAAYKKIVDSLYGTVELSDADGKDGIDSANITPYVFAAIYKEVETPATDDGKTTIWVFDTYAIVAYTDAIETEHFSVSLASRKWTGWKTKDKDGNEVAGSLMTGAAEYVATTAAKTLGNVEKKIVSIDSFDIRASVENKYIKFVGDTTLYTPGYTDLLAWGIKDADGKNVAAYYSIATNANKQLVSLYDMKTVADDKADPTAKDTNNNFKFKYVTAWVVDGNIVALDYYNHVTQTSGGTDTPDEDETKYAGILVLDKLPDVTIEIGAKAKDANNNDYDLVKLVNGKYYLVIKANVDGAKNNAKNKDILVYLADATEYVYNTAIGGDNSKQQDEWLKAENKKIAEGYADVAKTCVSGANIVVFYNVDANNNYVLETADAVTNENYKNYVGGSYAVTLPTGRTLKESTNIEYKMDVSSKDFIKYQLAAVAADPNVSGDKGKPESTEFVENIATVDTTWIFVTANGIELRAGVPEYKSAFSVASTKDIIKNGNDVVVFGTISNGFNYSMFQDAVYAIYDGSAALDWDVRDGYLHYNVTTLFGKTAQIMKVKEDDEATKAKLNLGTSKKVIIAMSADDEDAENGLPVLEVYTIDAAGASIAAIASLSYGVDAFETSTAADFASEAALKERIAKQYNLNDVIKTKMTLTLLAVTADAISDGNATGLASATTAYVFYTAATADKPANCVVFYVTNRT